MVVALLLLLGCQQTPADGPCADDPCRAERAPALVLTDFDAGIALLKAIDDPVYLSLAINNILSWKESTLTAEQGRVVCGVGGAVMERSHCERRFSAAHLRHILDAPSE